MVSIDARLGAIKRDPSELLDSDRVLELCREHHYWPEADGRLDPTTLIGLFIRQVAAGNVSCDQVRLMGDDMFTASGYCQMRMRMPVGVIRGLARDEYRRLAERPDRRDRHRWKGHRVLLIDATNFSMPDTAELRSHFGQSGAQKPGCGFPMAHVLMLFNARTGLAVDAITAPMRTHEMSLARDTHDRMSAGDLVVGDDSFGEGKGDIPIYCKYSSHNKPGGREERGATLLMPKTTPGGHRLPPCFQAKTTRRRAPPSGAAAFPVTVLLS